MESWRAKGQMAGNINTRSQALWDATLGKTQLIIS